MMQRLIVSGAELKMFKEIMGATEALLWNGVKGLPLWEIAPAFVVAVIAVFALINYQRRPPPASVEQERAAIVERFRKRLATSRKFSTQKVSDHSFLVISKKCNFSFYFERYDTQSVVLVSPSDERSGLGMSVNLLRYIRAARDILPDGQSPENLAEVFKKYFSDILNGDFGIKSTYDSIKDEFFDFYMAALRLPDDDPIKVKLKSYDITWMSDFRGRRPDSGSRN